MSEHVFDPERIFQILGRHDVDYVVIGAMAAILQGVALTTTLDVDVTASVDVDNRERLAAALREMDARLRVPDPEESVELPLDARMLASATVMTFITRLGPFDVLFDPAGAPPYEELRGRAHELERSGTSIRVADIRDVVSMKQATGREKDAAHLRVLLDHIDERQSDSGHRPFES